MVGTDHKAVVTEFQKGEFKRGPSTWKFNTSYLKESAFVQQINADQNFIRDSETFQRHI